MDLLKLSKQERFYFDVGEGIAMNNTRCLIDRNTLEVILYAPVDGDWDIELDEDGEEIEAEDKYSDPDKYMVIEPVTSHEAFEIMENFVDTVGDVYLRQRLTDALQGSKPFANFNRLVHNTDVREEWFDFKNRAYMEMAKEWISYAADDALKQKIKALPTVRLAD